MSFNRKLHLFRTFIALAAIASGCVAAAGWLVNRPETLRHALALANLNGSWKVGIEKLSWRPLRGELLIEGIEASKPGTRGSVEAQKLKIGYRLLGLLRGKLVVDALEIEGVKLSLPERAAREKPAPRKRIKLGRLLLLKNLEVEQAVVDGLGISFGESSSFSADQMRISLVPSFFGDTKLSIRTDGMLLSKGERPILSAGLFSLKASTDIARWGELFPYLNAVDGVVRISDANLEGLSAESLSASAALSDGLLKLSELKILIGGNPLEGWLTADASTGSFDLGVDIPKPISLPHFWRPMETMDLGGELSGRVRLEGKGFVPSESEGLGRAELTHRFSTHAERPVSVSSDLSWSEGVIRVPKAEISSGGVEVSASGQVDLARKHFKFEAKGSGFPLEDLFLEFTNPYLQRIFGPTDFTGSIEGWGKAFKARVVGTTLGGGWKPITAQRVESEFEATYDDLKLFGKIFSGQRQTGSADLKIRFGPKIGDADRSKFIELTASLSDHPAEDSLGAYGLAGTGSGTIKLTGPHTAFKGESVARIEKGSLYGIEFDLAKADLAISPKGILFSGMELMLPSLADAKITGALAGDTGGGAIRLHGTPAEGLSIDATYRGADSRWTIKEISWSDPERPGNRIAASGSVSTVSGMDLKLSGRVDLGALSLAAPLMREGSGPVDVDLAVRGTTADPRMFGSLAFNENTFSPRGARLSMERVIGAMRFEGHRVRFDGVRAVIDDGELRLGGTLDMRGLSPAAADMTIAGSAMRYRNEDSTLSMEIDGSLSMTGAFPSPLLKGDVTVLDGRYTKDFTILDAMTAGSDRAKRPKKDFLSEFDPRLDIRARNSGDLEIRNNVGDIWLNMNVGVKGTRSRPQVSGSIETNEGRIHYLGMDFEITKGFIEFMEKYGAPYLEATAQKEVGVYNITLVLHGPTDNLALDLSATSPAGPLEKRDVVSLLLFGVTEQERTALAQQSGAGGMLTTQMAGQAISGIVGRPIQKATKLDVFRLEASAPGASNVSRVYFGKKLTDRLSVNFATDINTTNAVQTVIGEYQITDNLLISGQRSSDSNYKVTGALRFRLR